MLAVLYFVLCFSTGYVLCSYLLPSLSKTTETSFLGNSIRISRCFVLLPAWYVSGTLFVTWTTYLTAYLFRSQEPALGYANTVSMTLAAVISCVGILLQIRRKTGWCLRGQLNRLTSGEILFFAAVIFLVVKLMWTTFSIQENQLYVGLSVFSDFAPHLGMIRSFSHGNNFPTVYSHYAGEDIRYHFMFQFLVGNLEFLGMRLDWAFNLPSTLSLVGVFSLLYALAMRLFGRRSIGYLAGLFFAFRCSPSFFTYLADIPKGVSVIETLKNNIGFIGYTTHEDWGLWNLNVYCNQRHLAFGMCVLLLVINMFLSHLFAMTARWKEQGTNAMTDKALNRVTSFVRFSLFHKNGWLPESLLRPVILGILLGLTAFWNGATLLATIMVLFVLAVVSDRRLEFLVTAMITACLSLLQNAFFMDGFAVGGAKFQFGFIAENTSLFGTMDYIVRLCGILILVLLVAFAMVKGIYRWILVAFFAPFAFSFLVSLTMDVTVNHKYIMISIMLMNLFAATLIVRLYEKKNAVLRVLCIGLVIAMTITGFYDYTTVIKRNQRENNLVFAMEDPLIDWLDENTTAQDVFLSPHYALSRAVLGGAMLFEGHGYYPMTAGYDTGKRYALTKQMYEASSTTELKGLIEENGIDYIIIDIDARQSSDYTLNEAVFDAAYEKVYTEGDGEWMLSIYDTSKPMNYEESTQE